jgi:hypothetical protein
MTKYVITPDVALRLARDEAAIPAEHQLLAPTLLRSQMLATASLDRSDEYPWPPAAPSPGAGGD